MVLFFCVLSYIGSNAQQRSKQTLNSHWYFHQGKLSTTNPSNFSNWSIINLPHSWNAEDVLNDGKKGYFRGEGWYSKPLHISTDIEKYNYYLHFEGSNQSTTVFINGQKAGEHHGGYTAFSINITPYLKKEDNTILIKVDNAHNKNIPPLSADFTFYGGIYRDLYLIKTAKTHFSLDNYGSSGVFINTDSLTENKATLALKGTINHEIETTSKYDLEYHIISPKGTTLLSKTKSITLNSKTTHFSETIEVLQPELWHPDTPNLYRVVLKILKDNKPIDNLTITTGIREFHFDPNKGFFINGEHLKLIGASRHQDFPNLGNALPDGLHQRDLKLLKAMGANFLRLAHYPQDPAILKAADRLGLLVWEEIPLVNEITISDEFNQNSETQLKEMIRQNYNHPSVILWGYMNEIFWSHRFLEDSLVEKHTEATLNLAKTLDGIARKEDPSRYTAMAMHNYPLYEASGLDTIPQVAGWNLYHGWYYDDFEDFGTFLDRQHELYPERNLIVSEFGAGSDTRLHSQHPERFDFTMEGQKRMMESFLQQIEERDFVAGAAVWALSDFNSESRMDTKSHWNQKGLLTAERELKDPYYLFQAYLLKTPFVKIAETNYKKRTSITKDSTAEVAIDIYSNEPYVKLFINGELFENKKVENYKTTFNPKLASGKFILEAVTKNTSDRLELEHKTLPFNSTQQRETIRVNLGSNHSFYNEQTDEIWISNKTYEAGSWGSIGGQPLYIGNKIGTKENVQGITNLTPLYQTMLVDIKAYQFDVPDGSYEIELYFMEPYPYPRKFITNESPYHKGGIRYFDLIINEDKIKTIDLLKDYGYNYPLRIKKTITAKNGEGIKVTFDSIKGKAILSGIQLKPL